MTAPQAIWRRSDTAEVPNLLQIAHRGIPRPAAITKPALALVAVATALFGIAKTTGSGWLIVILAGVGGVGALAIVLPALGVLRVTLSADAPRDAMVGHPMAVRLTLRGTGRPLLVRIAGDTFCEWTAAAPPMEGRVPATPGRRGIVDRLMVDVRCAAPLGLVWWQRRITCVLERPVEVGPWPADVAVPPPSGSGPRGHESRSAPHHGDDLVRGARDYRPGDPIKTVHWVASARHGHLMVKELEAAAAPPITVSVDLRVGGEDAEVAASLGAGVAVGALDAGVPVNLLTYEAGGPVAGAVTSRSEVSRRLARATSAGAPALPPPGAGGVVTVDQHGVRW